MSKDRLGKQLAQARYKGTKATSAAKSLGSKGGRARANTLSKAQKVSIATKGANTRWHSSK